MKFTPMTLTAARKLVRDEMRDSWRTRESDQINEFRNVCRLRSDHFGAPYPDIRAWVDNSIYFDSRQSLEFIQALLTLSAYHDSEYSERALASLYEHGDLDHVACR